MWSLLTFMDLYKLNIICKPCTLDLTSFFKFYPIDTAMIVDRYVRRLGNYSLNNRN